MKEMANYTAVGCDKDKNSICCDFQVFSRVRRAGQVTLMKVIQFDLQYELWFEDFVTGVGF